MKRARHKTAIIDYGCLRGGWHTLLLRALYSSVPNPTVVSSSIGEIAVAEFLKTAATTYIYVSDIDSDAVIEHRYKLKKRSFQIAFHHGFYYNPYEVPYDADVSLERERWIIESLDVLFVNSHFAAAELLSRHPKIKTRLIVLGLPVEVPKMPAVSRKYDVVVAGRISEDKQRMLLVKVMEKLRHEGFKVCACWVRREGRMPSGEADYGKESVMMRYLESLGVTQVVNLERAELLNVFAMSNALLAAPLIDTLNVTAIEAIMCGTVPVFPKMAPYTEFISSGYLYEPYSIKDMVSCCQRAEFISRDYQVDQYTVEAWVDKFKGIICRYL